MLINPMYEQLTLFNRDKARKDKIIQSGREKAQRTFIKLKAERKSKKKSR